MSLPTTRTRLRPPYADGKRVVSSEGVVNDKKLIAGDEAKPATTQHTKPCSDCPWRRDALKGWLGGRTPEQYQAAAHGEEPIYCHVRIGPQCAGAAIYRANVGKVPRNPAVLQLPKDPVRVFGIGEFARHHRSEESDE